jgi:cation diffusion facilitator CzcD-associated flavoprotein CzcO
METTTLDAPTPATLEGPSVAVIGCGPAGMFFLRQLEIERKRLLELKENFERAGESPENDNGENVSASSIEQRIFSLPRVTVFEQASRCGGLWQSKSMVLDENGDEKTEQQSDGSDGMYDGMWINAPKELFEFEDYTFDEHFKRPMPSFITRHDVLRYIEGATNEAVETYTRNGSIHFNTYVSWVEFNETTNMFNVDSTSFEAVEDDKGDYDPDVIEHHHFDKVIHATGTENSPQIPVREAELLNSANIDIPVLHSSQIKQLGGDITGKNFLFIGSAYSAEDLALSFIKRGANHIYVTTRSDNGYPVTSTSSWPMDKVTTLLRTEIKEVLTDGSLKMGRMELEGETTKKIAKEFYDQAYNDFVLTDIDAIVFCTGYLLDETVLDYELSAYSYPNGKYGEYNNDEHNDDEYDDDEYNDDDYDDDDYDDDDYDDNEKDEDEDEYDDDEYDDDEYDDDEYDDDEYYDHLGIDYYELYHPKDFNPEKGRPLPSETLLNSCNDPIHANDGTLIVDHKTEISRVLSATYNRHVIDNPGFFHHHNLYDSPLFSLDIQSAFILKVIMGDIPTPDTIDEMINKNIIRSLEWLRNSSEERYYNDEMYADALTRQKYKTNSENFRPYSLLYPYFILLLDAKKAGHPAGTFLVEKDPLEDKTTTGVSTPDCWDLTQLRFEEDSGLKPVWGFSEKGLVMADLYLRYYLSHSEIPKGTNKTFRDVHHGAYRSIYTGTKSTQFSKLWMEIDDILGDVDAQNISTVD